MSLEELSRRFIRPSHECSDEFDYAKSLSGTKELPFYCMKCQAHLIINNVCQGCGKDERPRYGDFEREMTLAEWENVRDNLPDPTPAPRPLRSTEEQRTYWSRKQAESRKRRGASSGER